VIARSVSLPYLVLAACGHEASIPERPDPVIVAEVPVAPVVADAVVADTTPVVADASVAPVVADAMTVQSDPPRPPKPPAGPAPKVGLLDGGDRKVLDAIVERNVNADAFKLSGVGSAASTTTDDIDRKMRQQAIVFKACYQRELARGRDIGGKVMLRFTVAETGAVSTVTASGMDRIVEECLVAAVKRIEFAPRTDGKPAHVTYPLLFSRQ